jgi:mono/diheme cytochrome c family protein
MRYQKKLLGYLVLSGMAIVAVAIGACTPRQPTEARDIPLSAMEEALSYKAPFGEARTAPPEIVTAGKALYEGKGRCGLCHGISGKGDGPAAHMHTPHLPSDFTNCAFQKEHRDGQFFWIIKYGSPGTGMQALIPAMLSEEEGWKIVAYIRTFCTEHS